MKWHCIKSFGKECQGEPEWEKEPDKIMDPGGEVKMLVGGICKLTPETCGKCVTAQLSQEELSYISQAKIAHTLIPIKKDSNTENAKQPKAGKKKEKPETPQMSMF